MIKNNRKQITGSKAYVTIRTFSSPYLIKNSFLNTQEVLITALLAGYPSTEGR